MRQGSFALLACIGLAATACTIGEQTDTTDDADQWAIGRPLKNGCNGDETASGCARRKNASSALACAYLRRVENAYFRVGGADEADGNWRVEQEAPLLTPDLYGARLDYICDYARSRAVPGYAAILVPTEAGCRSLAGTWNGSYCSAETPALPPDTETRQFFGNLEQGVPVYLPVVIVRPGAKVIVSMEGSGNPDLYVRFGDYPTASITNCRDTRSDGFGYCRLTVPDGVDRLYVGVYAPDGAASYGIAVEQN